MYVNLNFIAELGAMTDSRAAHVVLEENAREQAGELDPYDRLTCPLHNTWLYRCLHSPLHCDPLTGYRWCRPCRQVLEVAVDEVTGMAALHCPSCRRGAMTRMDARAILACERSLAASRARRPRRPRPTAAPAAVGAP